MARSDDRINASPAGQQLQLHVLQCLQLIMAVMTPSSWSAAWAEVSPPHAVLPSSHAVVLMHFQGLHVKLELSLHQNAAVL